VIEAPYAKSHRRSMVQTPRDTKKNLETFLLLEMLHSFSQFQKPKKPRKRRDAQAEQV
jgi:hypothetical protein